MEVTEPTLVQRTPQVAAELELELAGLSPLLARLYASRGISTAREAAASFSDLLPFSELRNCSAMADVLADACELGSRVLIVSDYDCDGATACAVLIAAFEGCGMNFDYLVPDRKVHGYGLTPSIVEEAALLEPKPEVIITVDNGISSFAGVELARKLGIEVLVTDHHLPPAVLPPALLIVNPSQPLCGFASKAIAGCGVAWYVAWALAVELKTRGVSPGYDPLALLPYVALGTVADVVQLDLNNRILIQAGLGRIRRRDCAVGIAAIASAAKRDLSTLTTSEIGFQLGPRINAAGRMAHMRAGIECLTTTSVARAKALAGELEEHNKTRRAKQDDILTEAADLYARRTDTSKRSVVVFDAAWHEGIVGIVAGRIKELRHRPAFVLCNDAEGNIKGSGRSIPGFHLKHALDELHAKHPGILLKFGGHAMAAGLTMEASRLQDFMDAFEAICDEHLTDDMLEKRLEHDGAITGDDLSVKAVFELTQQVWGQGFLEPMFVSDFQVATTKLMGEAKDHLRIEGHLDGVKTNAVAFRMGPLQEHLGTHVTMAHRVSVNTFRGNSSVQLMVEHIPATELVEVQPLAA